MSPLEHHRNELLIATFKKHALAQPEKTACVFLGDGEREQNHHTYGELDKRVCALASYLQKQSAPGQRAILLLPPGFDFLESFLACLSAGIIAVPLFPPRNQRYWNRLNCVLADADASLILTTSGLLSKIHGWSKTADEAISPQTKLLAVDEIETTAEVNDWQPYPTQPEQIALLQYTSGSTSAPKGVMVSHANLTENLNILRHVFDLSDKSVMVSWLPHYHDMGLIEGHLAPLFVGGTVYLIAPAAFLQQPIRWLKALTKYKATHTCAANFAFDLCVERITPPDLAGLDLSNLRTVLNGAEPIRNETVERFHRVFSPCGFKATAMCPGYGMAESTLLVTNSGGPREKPVTVWADKEALKEKHFIPANPRVGRPLVSSGQAAPGIEICITSPETGQPLPSGQIGEILMHGASIALGYWRAPEASRESFATKIPGHGDKCFLSTGDLGFLNKDGELFICGRIKDLIIIDGANYYPQDIEASAGRAHRAMAPDAGAAIPVRSKGKEHLVLIQEVRRTQRRNIDPQEIFAAVSKTISEEHGLALHRLVLLRPGTIPKTSSGKIQRSLCGAKLQDGSHNIMGQWPEHPDREIPAAATITSPSLKAWLCQQVAKTVGQHQQIQTNRPLAEYGLSSVHAVSLSGALATHLDRELPSYLLYQYPTIDALCDFLTASKAEDRPATVQQAEPVAIIGMACRFPGAENTDALWQMLLNGQDAVGQVPPTRWDASSLAGNGLNSSPWGAFLPEPDQFDAAFFGISPREAASLDPQQRLLLEVSWEALENAGQPPRSLQHLATGVFVGIGTNDYARLQHGALNNLDAYHATGNSNSLAANRISYFLDLHGPSMAIDTACSSSLVAVHQACRSLQTGESDLALAGGVNMLLAPDLTVALSQAQMMSPTGRCKTFDQDADGYVRGEGCGVVILKRLDRAIADGDQVLAIIRGSSVNHGGRSNGLTAPTVQGQETVIQAALNNANIPGAAMDFIEAHGTGTPLGDPIEMEALAHVLSPNRSDQHPVWVGSIKTNIGHLEAAAGIAGLIKSTLALQNKILPQQLHFQRINPDINENSFLRVADQQVSFANIHRPLCCGVSSFGFGGTNAHLILEGPTSTETIAARADKSELPALLPISAADPKALTERAGALGTFLDQQGTTNFTDLVHTLNAKMEHLEHRAVFIAASVAEFRQKLNDFAQGQKQPDALGQAANGADSGVVFVFSGQGTQWVGMGKALSEQSPEFRNSLERLDSYISKIADWSIFAAIDDEKLTADPGRLQPTLCALQISLANLFMSWGLSPAAVIGHSLGEVAAACIAGALSEEEAMQVALERGKVMIAAQNSGGLLATSLSATDLQKMIATIGGDLELAAHNSSQSTVASGPDTPLEELRLAILKEGEKALRLAGNTSFHHDTMTSLQPLLRNALASLNPSLPRLPIASTVHGQLSTETLFDADYWAKNIRHPVLFKPALASLTAQGYRHFVEIGPHPALTRHIATALAGESRKEILSAMRKDAADLSSPLRVMATLFAHGLIKQAEMSKDAPHPWLHLPAYPWQRQRHWLTTSRPTLRLQPESEKIWQECTTAGTRQSGFIPLELSLHDYAAKWDALNRLALADMELALRALNPDGTLPDPAVAQGATAERFHGLIQRWYQVLTEANRVEKKNGTYAIVGDQDLPNRSALISQAREVSPEITFLTDYLTRCGDQLLEILQGRTEALETLFPNGSWETVQNLYHDWSVPRYFNAIAAEILLSLTPWRDLSSPLRVLEVGGGTGGMTRAMLPTLSGHGVEYEYTDISPYFIEPLRQKLADFPFVSFGVFDLDQEPGSQGYQENSYDVIVAANSVHTVKNLPQTLRNLRSLLAPGGIIILYEVTRPLPWFDTSVALIEGWGNFKDDLRASTPLLSPGHWQTILAENGFDQCQSFPAADSPADLLAQHIIVARADHAHPARQDEERTIPAEWLYQLEWQLRQLPEEPPTRSTGTTLIIGGQSGIVAALQQVAESTGKIAIHAQNGLDAMQISQADHIVHLLNLDGAEMDLAEAFQHGLYSAQELLKTVLSLPEGQRPKLWFATSGACQVAAEAVDPKQSPIWGWTRSLAGEFPELLGGIVDLDPAATTAEQAQQLMAEIMAGEGEQTAHRNGQRYILRLVKGQRPSTASKISVKREGLYLISGGLGVLGQRIAMQLAQEKAGGVILLSRRAERKNLPETTQQTLCAMEAMGTVVHLVAADIADENTVRTALEKIEAETGQYVVGVAHAAGALDTEPLRSLGNEGLNTALHGKALGAWVLHRLFAHRALDFFTMFGSAASVLPPPSNGAYAAANAFLDCLAAHRHHLKLAATTLAWGSWEQAGAKAQKTVENLKRLSIAQIPFATGLAIFTALAANDQPHWVVLPGDIEPWVQINSSGMGFPLLQDLTQKQTAPPTAPMSAKINDPETERILRDEAANLMNLQPEMLDKHRPLLEQGLDSLMIIGLKGRIENLFGINIPVSTLIGATNLADLTTLINKTKGKDSPSPPVLNPSQGREVLSL